MAREVEPPAKVTSREVASRSYGKLVAFLAARTGDVAGAEDALSEAFASALEKWPSSGIPRVPEAWLLTVARRKMIDAARRRQREAQVQFDLQDLTDLIDIAAAEERPIPDARLALMFACTHPAIDADARAPLMLQTILGLDANAIGSAFLTSNVAMGQRLVRAKTKIREAGIGLRIPGAEELPDRLDAVLLAIYAAYAEGWNDAVGTMPRQRELVEESIWLGRLVLSLLPGQPEALGLVALMLHSQARRAARRDKDGEYVRLSQQDTHLWNMALIEEAETLLRQAGEMKRPGRFQLEAAVQSVHAARRFSGHTDWPAILTLYDALLSLVNSPVIAINRAIALSETGQHQAALQAVTDLSGDKRMTEYQPYWVARGELMVRNHDPKGADAAFARAMELERDPAVRSFLKRRRQSLGP